MRSFEFKHEATPDLIFLATDDGEKWIVSWVDEEGHHKVEYDYDDANYYQKVNIWIVQ